MEQRLKISYFFEGKENDLSWFAYNENNGFYMPNGLSEEISEKVPDQVHLSFVFGDMFFDHFAEAFSKIKMRLWPGLKQGIYIQGCEENRQQPIIFVVQHEFVRDRPTRVIVRCDYSRNPHDSRWSKMSLQHVLRKMFSGLRDIMLFEEKLVVESFGQGMYLLPESRPLDF